MKRRITFILFSTICVLSQSAYAMIVHDQRCETWGDSLNAAEATQRLAFALSCEKIQKNIRDLRSAEKQGVTIKNGTRVPGYPSYGKWNDAISEYENPLKWFAPPRPQAGKTGAPSCSDIPAEYEIGFFCGSGCYTPEQMILSDQGPIAIVQASAVNLASVQSLTPDSSMDKLEYQSSSVLSYISDVTPGLQEVLRFKMLSGGELRVTLNHPLINSAGEMAQAQSFKAGDALVKEDGSLDPILSIEKENYFGKVYNLRMASEDSKENILVAQGYLNGSVRYQNEFVDQLNRHLLRSVVARNLLN